MNNYEKVRFILDLLKKNIENIVVEISTETEKHVFCIKENKKRSSLIITDRFIEKYSNEEIIKIFNESHVYSEIINNKQNIQCITDDITLWPNDEKCQKFNL